MGYHSKKQELLLASASVIPLISLPLLSAGLVDDANAAEAKWDANVTARIHGDRNNVETSAELFLPLGQDDDSLFYLDLRIVPEDIGAIQGNFGGGIRQIVNDSFILGGYAFYDTAEVSGHRFHAATVGVEFITESFDAHVNYHKAITDKVTTASSSGSNSSTLSLVGNQLIESYQSGSNHISGMSGFSGELGYTLFFDTPIGQTTAPRELRLSAGAFSFDGFETQARSGFTANAEYSFNDALGISGAKLSFGVGVIHDNINDTNLVAGVRLTIPIGDLGPRDEEGEATSTNQPALTRLEQRMVSRVRRITRMQTQEVNSFVSVSRVAVDAVDASLYSSIWFADGANSVGAGTQADPTTINHAVTSASTNGIIVAEGNNGVITTPGGVTLQNGQEVLGGGTAIPVRLLNNTVVNFTLGQTNGIIQNLSNATVTIGLANNNILQNFTTRGGLVGIAGMGVSGATFNNITVDQSVADGVNFNNFSGTLTSTNLTVTNAGLDGIDINDSTGTFNFDTTTVTDSAQNGIDTNGAVGPITFSGTTNVSNSGDDGLDFDNVTGGPITFSGPLNVNGAGDDGINIDNGSATFTFADVTIDGTVGDDGVAIVDFTGTANFNGTTTITGPADDGIDISGGNGTFTFGQIDITTPGDNGIQISDAQGTATYSGPTTITGAGNDGISINDSPLVQTFNGTTTITTPTRNGLVVGANSGALTFDSLVVTGGAASRDGILVQGNLLGAGLNINTLNIDGFGNGPFSGGVVFTAASGTVNILGGTIQNVGNDGTSFVVNNSSINATFGGNIIHTGNGPASSAVFVDDNGGPDTSTLTFTAGSTISDTAGRGMRFENADGTYNFNGQVTLNGGDAGIDILGGSAGTFTFTNTDITSPTGTAVNIDGNTGNIAFGAGSTIIQNNAATAIRINNQTAGTVAFNGAITANTANFGAVDLTNNTGGTINFAGGLNLNTTSGDGFGASSGGTVSVTGAGNTINSTMSRAINLDGVIIGAGGMTFASIGSTNSTVDGARFNNVSGGAFNVTGATTINNATADGIDITGSAATFTFASVDIDGGVQGIDLNGNTGTFAVNGGTIDGTTGDGINALNTPATISGVTFGATTAIGGDGIDILNSDGTSRTTTIAGNTIGSATADITGRGVVIGSTGAGVATVNFTTANTIRSTNAALEATATTTNTLVMALDNITAERGTAGFTFDIQGASHAALTAPIVVTSLNSFTITANGTNGGALFNNVAFDADGVSGGAVTQVTATGTTNIGQGAGAAQRVQGDGLSFLSPNGDINFSTLNIFNNGGTGLEVDTKSVAPITTFNLAVGAGGVNTTGGAALFLDPLTGSLTFGSITSSGSAAGGATSTGASGNGVGITVDGFIGTLTSTTTSITGLAAGQTGVNFTNNTAGTTVNLGVTTISSTANNVVGIDLQNTNGETITTGAGSSINLTGTGTVGVDLSNAGTNANFTFGDGAFPPASSTITAATPIDFTGIGALGTYNFLDVDFTNVNLGVGFGQNATHFFAQTALGTGDGSSAANASNTTVADANNAANTTFVAIGGGNLDLNTNGDGTFNLAGDQDLATFATVGGSINQGLSGVPANILLNTTAGTITDGNAAGPTALTTSAGGGSDSVVVLGSNSQLANVQVNNAGAGAEFGIAATGGLGSTVFTNVDISGVGTGLSLNGTAGTLIADANSSITNTSQALFNETGGTANVTFNGTISQAGGLGVIVANKTAGTTTFGGAVTLNTATNDAVSLFNNTGATINFNGGLDIDTTNGVGFTAVGGGTISVANAGTETINTTGTAGAIFINGVTIGAGGLNFDSVTTAATNASNAVDINDAAGGAITLTTVSLAGTALTTGLDISGNARTSNVIIGGGTITSGVRINNSGTGTVQIDANVSETAGFAFQVANRGAGSGTVTVNGTITGTTGTVSIQSNSAGDVNFTNTVTGTGSNNAGAIDIDGTTGGTVTFSGLVDLDITGNGTGVSIGNTNAGGTFNFTGGLDINSVNGVGFEALSGTVGVSATAGVESVTTTNGQAVNLNGITSNITFDSISSTNSTVAGIALDTVGGSFTVSGTTTVTDAAGDGISLTGNAGTVTFGTVGIDLGATNTIRGIDIDGVNGQIMFGATTITDVKTTQTGIDFTGADAPATFGVTAISGPVNSAGTGIDLSSTQNNQAINFATGSSITFTGTGASIGVQLAASDLVATTANANFQFGDGALPTGSTISVGASGFTVDTIGLSAASGSYNFVDVAFTGNADLLSSGTAIFVSQAGGALTAGTFGLSNAITTIDVATAMAQADTNQTFTFVGNNLDFIGLGASGFVIDDGQSIDGFANGNSVATGTIVPANISGITGTAINVTANDTQITNTFAGVGDVFNITGSSTVQNVVIDGSGATAGSLFHIIGSGTAVIQNIAVQNDTAGRVFNVASHSGTVTIQNNTINTASRLLHATGTGNVTLTRGTGTAQTAQDIVINKTGGTVDFNGNMILNGGATTTVDLVSNANTTVNFNGDLTLNGATNAVNIVSNTITTFNFNGLVDINNSTANGVFLNNNATSTINFLGGLDISTTAGTAFVAATGGTVSVANAGTEQIVTTGTGGAINLNGIIVGAGGINFDQVTTAAASTATGIEVNTTTGGALNIASANLNGTNASLGLLVSDANSTVNVVAGTINNGVRIVRGANPVTIGASITKATGAALDIFRRNTASAITINGNITSSATAVNVFQAGGALLNVNGTVTGTGTAAGGSIDLSQNGGGSVITFTNTVNLNMTGAGVGVHQDVPNGGADVRFNGGLVINTVDGTGLEFLSGRLLIANAATETITTTGTGRALNLDSVIVSAGGINFDQVTTSAATTSAAVRIDDASGATITLTSVNLNGTALTTGLDIGGSLRSANVIVSGGTIASGVGISDSGTGTVQIDANISDNAGFAFQVANRGAGSGAITVNGTVTNAFGAVSLQSNTAGNVTFNGVVTGTGANNAGAIDIDGTTGGTVTFAALVDLDVTGNGTGVKIGAGNAGGTFNFNGGLDINSVNGVGFEALSGTVGVANAGVEQVTTTGTAGAINLNGVTVGAGGINFDSVTTAATATSNAVDINDASGGVITLTTVNLAGTAASTGLDISGDARTSNVIVSGGTIASGVRIDGDGAGTVQIDANITENAGFAVQVANRDGAAGAVTVNGTVTGTTGTVSIQNNTAGAVLFNGVVTGTGANTAGAIDIDGTTGGTVTFAALVDIDVTGNGTGVKIGAGNAGGTFNFNGGLDINSVNGVGFEALSGTVGVSATASVEQVTTTGTAGAINLDGVTVAAGGITFDSVTTAATATSNAIDINDASGGAITFTTVNLAGTALTTGLDISGDARTSNVIVSGGTIASGVRIDGDGAGTVQIDANITENAGFAVQVANRDGAAGAVTVNGTVTGTTGTVSIQSNTAGNVTFNGIVTGTGANTAGAIDIDGTTGGIVTFAALVDIDVINNGTGVKIGAGNAGGTFNFNGGLDINSVNGVGFEALSGTVNVAATAGVESVTTTNGQAVNLNGITAGITFDSLSSTNSTVAGIALDTVAGSFAVSGTTTVTDAAGDGISLTSNAGTVTFGATAINLGATVATAGIDIEGTNGNITFGDVDITDVKANQTGFDASGGTVDALILANTLDITGVGAAATGARGIDLTGYTNSKNFTNTASGTIVGVQFGVDLTNSNIANGVRFQYGDGAAPVGSAINTSAVAGNFAIVTTGATATGEYDFEDVAFAGSNISNLTGGASFFVFDEEGTVGAGTFLDPGTAGQAEAASVDVLIAVDNSGVGGSTIDFNAVGQGAAGSLNLDDNQALIGLINGQTIDASTLGLGLAAGPSANFLFTGLGGGSTNITGSGVAGAGLATLTTTGVGGTILITGTSTVQSVVVANGGTGDGVNAIISASDTVTINSSTIGGAAGADAIHVNSIAGTGVVNISNVTLTSALRLEETGTGTLAANSTGTNTINVASGAAVFINGVTTNLTLASITGNGGASTSDAVKLQNLGANSNFTVTGTTTLDNYTNDGIEIQSISQNDVTVSFGAININTTVGQVVAGGDGLTIATISGSNFDLDVGALSIGNTTNDSDSAITIVNVTGTGVDIDIASYTSNRSNIGMNVFGFNTPGATITVAGTTNITNARADGIRIGNSAGNVTFGGNTTITNNSGFNGDGVDISNNTGTYSFAGLDVSVTGAGAFGLRAQSSGTLNITGGTNNITSNNGTAVFINPTIVNATFQSLTSSNAAGNGVDLTLATGSTFTVTGSTNINSSTGNGVNIVGQAGTQTVSLGALNINNNGGPAGGGLFVNNNTTGTLNVNSTSGNINTGNDTAIQILNASTGTITLGVALTGVSVDGAARAISIDQSSTGTIDGTLNTGTGGSIANTTSQAILIDSTTGTLTIGQAVTSTAGRIADIQRVSAGGTVTLSGNLTGTGASSGIVIINNTGGTINLSGATNTVNATATAFNGITLTNNAGSTVNFAGALDIDTAGGLGLLYNNGGTVTFTGALTIDTTTGIGLNVINSGAGSFTANNAGNTISTVSNNPINISGATVNATFATVSASALNGSKGIDINGHTGTLTVNGGTITNLGSQTAIEISGGAGTISIGSNVISNGATGRAVDIQFRTGGVITLSGNFTDNASTGGGIFVNNNANTTINISGTSKVVNTATVDAVTFTSNSGSTINFTNGGLNIDTTSGTGITISNSSAFNVSGASNTIDTTSGAIIAANGVTFGATFASASATALAGATDGVNVANSNGTLTINGGTMTLGGSGQAFHITSSSVTLSSAQNVVSTGATSSTVRIQSVTGGTNTFSGNFTDASGTSGGTYDFLGNSGGSTTFTGDVRIDSGNNNAILFSSNAAHTVNFNGTNTDIDNLGGTNSRGLVINGGGTINFNSAGTNTLNIIGSGQGIDAGSGGTVVIGGTLNVTTASGTAVDISGGSTIGAAGVTFRSVSANGAVNGIVLNNTGTTGAFTITGTGTTDGSGGAIRNTTGSSILLTNVTGVSISNMDIVNSLNHGIQGTTVTNLDLNNVDITSPGNAANENGINITNLLGTTAGGTANVFNDLTITGASENGIDINNNTATNAGNTSSPDILTVQNSNISTSANTGILVETDTGGTGNLRLDVTGSGITDNSSAGVATNANGGNLQTNITNNTIGHAGGNTFRAISGGATSTGNLFFNITSNALTANNGGAGVGPSVIAYSNTGSGNLNGFIGGAGGLANTITNNTPTGVTNVSGISVTNNGAGSSFVRIQNNTINVNDGFGIIANVQGANSGSGHFHIQDNNVTVAGTSFNNTAISMENTSTSGTQCVNITNNAVSTNPIANADIVFNNTPTGTFQVQQTAGVTNSPYDFAPNNHLVESDVRTANGGTADVIVNPFATGSFTPGICTAPSTP